MVGVCVAGVWTRWGCVGAVGVVFQNVTWLWWRMGWGFVGELRMSRSGRDGVAVRFGGGPMDDRVELFCGDTNSIFGF